MPTVQKQICGFMELLKLIKTRRTIRKYGEKNVEKEKLMKVLEAARWAPSWANTQCWEFIAVRDAKTKAILSETLPKTNPAKGAVANAPIVIAVCGKKGTSGYIDNKPIPEKKDSWQMFDLGLAMENLTLMAHSMGLGTVHVGWFSSKKAKKILKVPENIDLIELVPLGYPAKIPKRTTRKEIGRFVFLDRYGRRLKRWTRLSKKHLKAGRE